MAWEQSWSHIDDRDWDVVRSAWLRSIPPRAVLGTRPDPTLSTLAAQQGALRGAKLPIEVADVPAFRATAFCEAMFLLHKGLHVLRAAQMHAGKGMPSWSLFSAYHSAFLLGKSISYFLGVCTPLPEGRQWIVDLFPQQKKKHVRKKPMAAEDFVTFKVIPVAHMDQRHSWGTLLRTIRLASVSVWKAEESQSILALNFEEFSPVRNKFIYSPPFWPFDDLFTEQPVALVNDSPGFSEFDLDKLSFLFSLACRLAGMAEALAFDLAKHVPSVSQELQEAGYVADGWRNSNGIFAQYCDVQLISDRRVVPV
jgi:hypothetical protein